MSDSKRCPTCGAVLPPDGPCVNCLLKVGISAGGPTVPDHEPEATPASERSTQIGPYKLLQQIGEGGMGTVWMADQSEPIRRRVALKIIKLGMDSGQILARFDVERQALALMDHPNIAKILDAGSTPEGRPYFVMELVKGIPLTKFCDERRLSIRERLELFMPVCQAIQHAHQKGIIHRDIKPSNVLVALYDGQPVPKVIDFGIAKATGLRLTERTLFTELGVLIGTPEYMSPEQAEMNQLDIDTRSDIYSLGVLLYELLTGTTPLKRETLRQAAFDEVLRRVREEEPPKPSTRLSQSSDRLPTISAQRKLEPGQLMNAVRGDLDLIVMKALEKERNRRYETANGLATDLRRFVSNEPVVARPPSNLYRFQKMVRRNKLAFAATGAVAAALVIGLGVSTWSFVNERRAAAKERQAHQLASAAEKKAQDQAKRAEVNEAETKLTLAAADFSQAIRLIADDKGSDALAYLGRSLRTNPTNEAAVTRLTTLLTYHSWPILIVSLPHSNAVSSARFSPDGRRVVTASGQRALIWDVQSGQPVMDSFKHNGSVVSAQFSPNGTRIVTASDDHTAVVWDANNGQRLAGPLKHDGPIRFAQFSPDGNRIVTASDDKTARVWDAQSGQLVTGPLIHPESVSVAQFSSDGAQIVTGSADEITRMWDSRTGALLAGTSKHGRGIEAAQFSLDGETVFSVGWGGHTRAWNARSGQRLTNAFEPPGVSLTRFSADGGRMVHVALHHTVRVLDSETRQPLTEPFMPRTEHPDPFRNDAPVISAEFSADRSRVVIACEDHRVHVWNVEASHAMPRVLAHVTGVNSARFSSNGQRLVTACDDKTARVWEAETGRQVTGPLRHDGRVSDAQFSRDGRRIVTASDDMTSRVWDAQTGVMLARLLQHEGKVTAAEFSPDGQRILTGSEDKTARLWDTRTGEPVTAAWIHNSPVRSAQFSSDGSQIMTGSDDGTSIWDVQPGRAFTDRLKINNGWAWPRFSPDGRRIVGIQAWDWTARVWDSQTGQELLQQPLRHRAWVGPAEFSPEGDRIVSTSWGMALLWDAHSGQPLAKPMEHFNSGTSARFSPDGRWIVSAAWDRTARVWDTQTGVPLTDPLKHSWSAGAPGCAPDGKRLATISGAKVYVWDIAPSAARHPEWLIGLAEAICGQAVNRRGLLEATSANRLDIINKIRRKLERESEADDWVLWGRWFLADPSTRTISPFSKIRVAE